MRSWDIRLQEAMPGRCQKELVAEVKPQIRKSKGTRTQSSMCTSFGLSARMTDQEEVFDAAQYGPLANETENRTTDVKIKPNSKKKKRRRP